jgi:hypothetical protein
VSDSPKSRSRVGPRKVVPGKIPINPTAEEIATNRRVYVVAYEDQQNAKRERVVVSLDSDVPSHGGFIDMPANDWCTLLDYMMEFLWGRDVEEAFDAEPTSEEEAQAEDERPRPGEAQP